MKLSQALREMGADAGLIERAEELEALELAVRAHGGAEQIAKNAEFVAEWWPVILRGHMCFECGTAWECMECRERLDASSKQPRHNPSKI